jgi:hypothetical protein
MGLRTSAWYKLYVEAMRRRNQSLDKITAPCCCISYTQILLIIFVTHSKAMRPNFILQSPG